MKTIYTLQEKIAAVEWQIRETKDPILKAVAADLRARLGHAPSAAETEITIRLRSVLSSLNKYGAYESGKMIGLANIVISKWQVIQQALERFGSEIETGIPAGEEHDARQA